MANQQRQDPIREKYYKPVELAESAGDKLFWVTTGISVALVFIDRKGNERAYDILQWLLVATALISFFVGMAARLYALPRALDARRADLLSQVFEVPLTNEKTTAYYNNVAPPGMRRLAATVLENTFFSKEISREMCNFERIRAAFAAVVFIGIMRADDLAFPAIAAATVFGEQVFMRWLRLEWFRVRSEQAYERLYRLLLNGASDAAFSAEAVDGLTFYESGKALAASTLSDRIFKKRNDELSARWDELRATIGI